MNETHYRNFGANDRLAANDDDDDDNHHHHHHHSDSDHVTADAADPTSEIIGLTQCGLKKSSTDSGCPSDGGIPIDEDCPGPVLITGPNRDNTISTMASVNLNINAITNMTNNNHSCWHTSSSLDIDYSASDDSSDTLINNKNKTCGLGTPNRSNCSTFVPVTSSVDSPAVFDKFNDIDRLIDNNHDKIEIDNIPSAAILCDNLRKSENLLKNYSNLIRNRKQSIFWKNFNNNQNNSINYKNKILIDDRQLSSFPCVEKLVQMYTKLIEEKREDYRMKSDYQKDTIDYTNNNHVQEEFKMDNNRNLRSPISDEGRMSDYDENDLMNNNVEKVIRSTSSDSALGLEDDINKISSILSIKSKSTMPINIKEKRSGSVDSAGQSPPAPTVRTGRRMTLTVSDIPLRPALLPLAEPTNLPDSPTLAELSQHPFSSSSPPVAEAAAPQSSSAASVTSVTSAAAALVTQSAIPSKVILEERIVEIPEDKFNQSNSRRESAQSFMSDYNSSEYGGVRYVRTPSVVVSDYSDDVMCGITLEEIEYFRAHRMRRRSSADTATTEKDDAASDVSAASSCSNLYYCGSTISALDGADCYVNGLRISLDRKISDCSTCSTVSCEDDEDHFVIQDYDPASISGEIGKTHYDSRKHKKL